MDKGSIKQVSIIREENLTKEEVKVVEPVEKVYVEVLAVEDKNETNKVESKSVEVKKVEFRKEVEPEKEKVVSEYSEGYKLDDLERIIMEELKKGNKD